MTKPKEQRGLPANLEIEKALVGNLMHDLSLIPWISSALSASDFFSEACRLIFRTQLKMHAEGCPIDLRLMVERLERDQVLNKVGGAAFVASTIDDTPVMDRSLLDQYVRVVTECSAKRKAAHFGQFLTSEACNGSSIEDLIGLLKSESQDLEQFLPHNAFIPMGDHVMPILKSINSVESGKLIEQGVRSGIRQLDQMTGGFSPGTLTVVAARPGGGKSSLVSQICLNSGTAKHPSAIASLEMTAPAVVYRMACQASGVSMHKSRMGWLSSQEKVDLRSSFAKLCALPLFVWDIPSCPVSRLVATVEAAAKREGLSLVVVDYLQLVQGSGDGRVEQVTKVSNELQKLAREIGKQTGGCLIAVSQLSRAGTDEPQLHHLRESGAIEQDADNVIFIWDDPDSPRNTKFIKLAKQRNGPTATWKMAWRPECFRFEELAEFTK